MDFDRHSHRMQLLGEDTVLEVNRDVTGRRQIEA
jgi:hypothetical protein